MESREGTGARVAKIGLPYWRAVEFLHDSYWAGDYCVPGERQNVTAPCDRVGWPNQREPDLEKSASTPEPNDGSGVLAKQVGTPCPNVEYDAQVTCGNSPAGCSTSRAPWWGTCAPRTVAAVRLARFWHCWPAAAAPCQSHESLRSTHRYRSQSAWLH